jgi:uncharacterized protein YidB (DUF937 family)
MAYIEDILLTMQDRLESIETKLNRALGMALGDARRDKAMATSLETLKKEVAESGDATESAVTLIAGLAEQIRNAVGDDEALEQLAADLEAQQQKLAKAVTENTPHNPSGM